MSEEKQTEQPVSPTSESQQPIAPEPVCKPLRCDDPESLIGVDCLGE